MMIQKILTGIIGLTVAGGLSAQNTTNTPTSMYGLGEIAASDGGKYAGLGSAGIALNRRGFMNTQNPACISSMDTTCFVYDIGMTGSYSRYSMLGDFSTAETGNPSRVSLGLRLLPGWYAMVGVAPYSSVGYMIKSAQEVEGTNGGQVSSLFEGTGGLYKLYLTNAFLIGRKISLGVNLGMISGTVQQTETQESAIVTRKSEKGAFYVDFGLHYALSKNWSVGGVYGFSTRLKQNGSLTYENSSTDDDLDVNLYNEKQFIPQRIGGGLTFENKRWVVTGDYSWMQWSRNHSSVSSVKYIDQHRANLGTVFIMPSRKPNPVELMMGVGYSNSYVVLKQGKMYNLDLSAGAAFPIRETVVSLGVTWRKQMNSRSNLMQEDRLTLNLNITFGEKLSRGKIF